METPVRIVARIRHVYAVRLLVASLRVLRQAHGGSRAAEIAYYAILSTIPLGMLVLSALAFSASHVMGAGLTQADIASRLGVMAARLLPSASADVEHAANFLLRDRGALGLFGTSALFITSSLVFGAINRALAAVFDCPARNRITTTALFSVGVSACALVFIVVLPWITAFAGSGHWKIARYGWLHAAPVLAIGLVFLFFVHSVVRAGVALRHSLLGMALFIALFEVARVGFTFYVQRVSELNVVYGSFAGIMVAIIWAEYVALTLLLSASLVRVLHSRLARGPLGDFGAPSPLRSADGGGTTRGDERAS